MDSTSQSKDRSACILTGKEELMKFVIKKTIPCACLTDLFGLQNDSNDIPFPPVAKSVSSSFTVNLRNSRTENIALHLNPRMKSGVFIRNSYLSESWGQEERELPFFPFSSGDYFEILILCQPHQFKLAVNGSHLFEFRHRVQDLSSIDQLEIMGDLELTDVKLW